MMMSSSRGLELTKLELGTRARSTFGLVKRPTRAECVLTIDELVTIIGSMAN